MVIFLFTSVSTGHSQQVYTPQFGVPDYWNRLTFTTEATGVNCEEEFICSGLTHVEDITEINSVFRYWVNSPLHININMSYSGEGYPRFAIWEPGAILTTVLFAPDSKGHFYFDIESFFEQWKHLIPNTPHNFEFIFFVVGEENRFVEQLSRHPSTISIPMTGDFAFSILATFNQTSVIPELPIEFPKVFDPEPDPGPLTTNQSYIRTRTMINDTGSIYFDTYDYYDGLGRPVQTVQAGMSPTGGDIVTVQQYDGVGREHRSWLPTVISGNNGRYVNPNTVMSSARTQYDNDLKPYSFPVYEQSPLSPLKEQFMPGMIMTDLYKAVQITHFTNSWADSLICINYRFTENSVIDTNLSVTHFGEYKMGDLHVTRTENEDGHRTFEFINNLGQLLLSRQVYQEWADKLYADTYYIYDHSGNLRVVLPPMASDQMRVSGYWSSDSDIIKQYAYLYKYDARNRCIAKKLPGADWIYYVYDKGDRVVAEQDGYFREQGSWKWILYDVFGRVIGVRRYIKDYTREQMQGHADAPTVEPPFYFPAQESDFRILEAMRYDDPEGTGLHESLKFEAVSGVVSASDVYPLKGVLNYERKAVANGTDFNVFPYTMHSYYYDYKGRLVQKVDMNHLGGISRTSFRYDFVGNVLSRHESHEMSNNALPDILQVEYAYDHRGRLLSETTTLNAGIPALITYTYDELGRLAATNMGTGTNAAATTYDYNIQGWMTKQENPHFDMELRYYDPNKAGTEPSYTGNITEWEWRHKGADATTMTGNTYGFTYDGLGRLTDTRHYEGGSMQPVDNFAERNLTYDYNGNTLSLDRYEEGRLENSLAYQSYNGNQLTVLRDNGPANTLYTYSYDSNGNMTYDGRQEVNLSYNYLDLVAHVSGSGESTQYKWLADGTKVSVINSENNGYEYLGSLVYERRDNKLTLESAGFSGGRIIATTTSNGTSYEPHYFITDHLGSVRVVVDNSGNAITRNDYHSFGKRWEGAGIQATTNRWQYNGKELQEMAGLSLLDYGWRNYDPFRGGWNGMDKMLESYFELTPYGYAGNNPVRHIDVAGLFISPYYDWNGNFLGTDEKGFTGDIYITSKEAFEYFSYADGLVSSHHIQNYSSDTRKLSNIAVGNLTPEAESKIYTHVLNQMNDIDFSNLYNGMVSINAPGKDNYNNGNPQTGRFGHFKMEDGSSRVTVMRGKYFNELNTVESIQNFLGVHEYYGHGIKGYSGENPIVYGGTHYKAYEAQRNHPTYNHLNSEQKQEIDIRIKTHMMIENPSLYIKRYK